MFSYSKQIPWKDQHANKYCVYGILYILNESARLKISAKSHVIVFFNLVCTCGIFFGWEQKSGSKLEIQIQHEESRIWHLFKNIYFWFCLLVPKCFNHTKATYSICKDLASPPVAVYVSHQGSSVSLCLHTSMPG